MWLSLLTCFHLLCDNSGFKNLRSLEICGGGLTDAGVKNIKDLSSLTLLNLSQNNLLTDRTLELISGISRHLINSCTLSFVCSSGIMHPCYT